MLPSTSCDLCSCKVWSSYVQQFRGRCIYMKIHYLTLTLRSGSHKMLPSTLYIMWPIQIQSLKLVCLTTYEEIIYNKIHYLPFVKFTRNVAHFPLHHVIYSGTKFQAAISNGLRGDTFTRKYIIWPLTLTMGVTQNVAQFPLLHVTYSGTKKLLWLTV